ncbi:MAG: MerR family transcriptional regulator [Fibrobacterota bacterium]
MINNRKTYYSIREVCTLTDLEAHVLRYWESEFPQLRPKKNRAGNRAYREKDIEIILAIKHLLYSEQFTIPGAKKKIAEAKESDCIGKITTSELSPEDTHPQHNQSGTREIIQDAISELQDLMKLLRPAQQQ